MVVVNHVEFWPFQAVAAGLQPAAWGRMIAEKRTALSRAAMVPPQCGPVDSKSIKHTCLIQSAPISEEVSRNMQTDALKIGFLEAS